MSELSPRARELVSSGKGALRPNDADRERVFQALQGRLTGPLGAGDASAPSSSIVYESFAATGTSFTAAIDSVTVDTLPTPTLFVA